jgi:hypothetical protein
MNINTFFLEHAEELHIFILKRKRRGKDPHTTHTSIQPVTAAPGKEKMVSSLLTHPSNSQAGLP